MEEHSTNLRSKREYYKLRVARAEEELVSRYRTEQQTRLWPVCFVARMLHALANSVP
jgi:hypothetical protein